MGALEQEIEKLHDDIVEDLYDLVRKYEKIIGWDIPENDEKLALKEIVRVMKEAMNHVEAYANNMENIEVIGDDFE